MTYVIVCRQVEKGTSSFYYLNPLDFPSDISLILTLFSLRDSFEATQLSQYGSSQKRQFYFQEQEILYRRE